MQSSSQTHYQISVSTTNDSSIIDTGLYPGDGWDDESAAAFVQILRDFPWPAAGMPVRITANKVAISTDTYGTDTSVTPPIFI